MVLVEYPQNIPSNSGYSVIPWPLHCSASVLCPSRAVRSTSLAAMTTAAGIQALQTLGFCSSALVSTSDGYFKRLPFLNIKKGLDLRTEGLWCVTVHRG